MKKKPSIWERACEYETEHGGGMKTILDFLASVHAFTDEAKTDLACAYARYDEQMNEFARYKR